MKFLKGVGIVILGIFLFAGIGFLTGNIGLFFEEYFGERQQNIETEIYKNTEMYNEAKTQSLAKAKLEYEQADSTGKKAVASMIKQRFADYEADRLPEGLADFLIKIRGY